MFVRHRLLPLLVGGGAVAVLAWIGWLRTRSGESLRQALIDGIGTEALLDARLVGFRYPPLSGAAPRHNASALDRIDRIVADLGDSDKARLRNGRHAEDRHDRGLLELLVAASGGGGSTNELDRAVSALRAAALADPREPVFRSDLAAALLHRAAARSGVADLLDAVEEAHEALTLEPEMLEARYNLAVALDRLYLRHRASAAYREYLELDRGSPWARQVRQRLADIDLEEADSEPWARQSLEQATVADDTETVGRVVRSHPALAQDLGLDELLPEWGKLMLGGALEADDFRSAAEVVGRSLAAFNGDRLLLDTTVAATDSRAARGLVAWGEAAPLVRRRAYEEAEPHLREVRELLSPTENPLKFVADYYLAVIDYQQERYERAYESLEDLAAETQGLGYPSLERKIYRMLGGIQHFWGNLSEAHELFKKSLALAFACRDRPAAANDRLPLAVVTSGLGDRDGARETWWAAVRERSAVRRPDYRYLLFATPAGILSRSGAPVPAAYYQSEAVAIASQSDDPTIESDAYLKLIEILSAQSNAGETFDVLEAAEQSVARIASESVREFRQMELLRWRAEVFAKTDTAAAAHAFDVVLARVRSMGFWRLLPAILNSRAQFMESSAESRSAYAAFLHRAIEEVERRVEMTEDNRERFVMLGSAEPIYERLAREQWRSGSYDAALETYDRLHSVELWYRRDSWEQKRGMLPAQTPESTDLVIAYASVGEEILAWTSRGGRMRTLALPLSRGLLLELLEDLDIAIRHDSEAELGVCLGQLYQAVVEPLDLDWLGIERLTVVAYRELIRIPFSALRDRNGDYLFERVEVQMMAALPVHHNLRQEGPERVAGHKVLAVGDPSFNRKRFPELEGLPGARDEALAIYGLYSGGSTLLVGAHATAAAVREELPNHSVSHVASHVGRDPSDLLHTQIILAPTVDGDGRTDHGLHGHEMLDLDLSSVRLVVLSACGSSAQTLTPHESADPGLVPSLLAAGVGTVVASAWPVEDSTASPLMVRVHEHLLAGLDPIAALRAAKLDLRRQPTVGMRSAAWVLYEAFSSHRHQ